MIPNLINVVHLLLICLIVYGTYLSWTWEPWYFALGPVISSKTIKADDLSAFREYLDREGGNLDGSTWLPPILAREIEPGTYALRQQISSGGWMDFNPMFFMKGIVEVDQDRGVLTVRVSLNWPMTAFSAMFLLYVLTVLFRDALGTDSVMPVFAVSISGFYLLLSAAHFVLERWRYKTIFRKLTDKEAPKK